MLHNQPTLKRTRRQFLTLGLALPVTALVSTPLLGARAAQRPLGSAQGDLKRLLGSLLHLRADLTQLARAGTRLRSALPTVAGHARMLERARQAFEAWDFRAARSVLAMMLSHARHQGQSRLLVPEDAAAMHIALSHILTEMPGSDFEHLVEPGISQNDFVHALQAIGSRGTPGPHNPLLLLPSDLVGSESSCNSSQTLDTISEDIGIVLANALDEVPVVGWALSSLVEILWPRSTDDTWCVISQGVEKLIKAEIDQLVRETIEADLEGLQNVIAEYLQAVDPSENNPGTYIYTKWNFAEESFYEALPHFTKPGYELLTLTYFAQFANLYLTHLRDGVLYGKSWGLTDAAVQDLKDKMATFLDPSGPITGNAMSFPKYATHWYEDGLQRVPIPTTGEHLNVRQFNAVNGYVRTMTLAVLDYAATWPYLDPVKYPDPVQVKLTREIYSDAMGTSDDSVFSVNRTLVDPVTHLTVWGFDRIDAMRVAYGGVFGPRMGDSSGGSDVPPTGINTAVGAGSAHGALSVAYGLAGTIINAAGFQFADGHDTGKMGGRVSGGASYSWAYQNHVVSKIKIMGISNYYGSADCIVYGFRYADGY